MRLVKLLLVAVLACILLVALGLGAAMLLLDDRQLTNAPPASTADPELLPSSAHVVVPLHINLQHLRSYLDEKIPEELYTFDKEKERVKCFGPKDAQGDKSACVDFRFTGVISRNGPLDVMVEGNRLIVQAPVKGRVVARGMNGLAKLIKRTIKGEFLARFAVTVREGPGPAIDVQGDYEWTVPAYIKVLGNRISLQKAVDKVVRKGVNKVATRVRVTINNHNRWNDRLHTLYREVVAPIRIAKQPDVWLVMEGKRLSLFEISEKDGNLVLPLELDAEVKTVVGPKPARSDKPPPPIVRATTNQREFDIRLPVLISYRALEQELLNNMAGEKIEVSRRFPGAYVEVEQVSVYPSDGKLALGIKFKTGGLADWLAADGHIYLLGTPVVDNENKIVLVPDLSFTRKTTNTLWNVSSYYLFGPIKDELRRSAAFRFRKQYAALLKDANIAFNQQYGDFALKGKLHDLRIETIQMRKDALVVYVNLRGIIEAINL